MTQISISIPKATLQKVDKCRAVDRRSRSNWIVTELERRIALLEAREALEKAGEASPRTDTFRSTAEASTPREGFHLNEEPAHTSAVPTPSETAVTRTRAVMRALAKKSKPPQK